MKAMEKRKLDLDKKFKKVLETPASFAFFTAIHDFVEHIKLNSFLHNGLSSRAKANQKLNIANKYDYLKKIYQGLEDINIKSGVDLGHSRYIHPAGDRGKVYGRRCPNRHRKNACFQRAYDSGRASRKARACRIADARTRVPGERSFS